MNFAAQYTGFVCVLASADLSHCTSCRDAACSAIHRLRIDEPCVSASPQMLK